MNTRLAQLETLTLLQGSHQPDGEMCVMEAVAWVAGEPWTDEPICACPVIGSFLRSWNDCIKDDAHRTELLRPLVRRLVGSKSTPAVELQRSYLAFDWLARVQAPAWLDLTPALKPHADALRALLPLTDKASVASADAALAAARAAAWTAAWAAAGTAAWAAAWDAAGAAARAAAGAAARAAAGDAARAAAGDAAGDAAGAAAGAAARDAAGAAAWDAAGDAARARLAPTVAQLEVSALDLVNRMLDLTADPVGCKEIA